MAYKIEIRINEQLNGPGFMVQEKPDSWSGNFSSNNKTSCVVISTAELLMPASGRPGSTVEPTLINRPSHFMLNILMTHQ